MKNTLSRGKRTRIQFRSYRQLNQTKDGIPCKKSSEEVYCIHGRAVRTTFGTTTDTRYKIFRRIRRNISPDEKSDSNKNDEQRLARLKKNKLKAGRRNQAKQRKQVWNKYKAELTEYNKKKAEREAPKSTKRERIEELTKELYTLMNNGKTKEDQRKEVRGSAKQPGEEVPQEPQGEQPPKKSSFQRLGPVESADVNGR